MIRDFFWARGFGKSQETELFEVLEQLLSEESLEEPMDLSSLVDEVVSRVADQPLDGKWWHSFLQLFCFTVIQLVNPCTTVFCIFWSIQLVHAIFCAG